MIAVPKSVLSFYQTNEFSVEHEARLWRLISEFLLRPSVVKFSATEYDKVVRATSASLAEK